MRGTASRGYITACVWPELSSVSMHVDRIDLLDWYRRGVGIKGDVATGGPST